MTVTFISIRPSLVSVILTDVSSSLASILRVQPLPSSSTVVVILLVRCLLAALPLGGDTSPASVEALTVVAFASPAVAVAVAVALTFASVLGTALALVVAESVLAAESSACDRGISVQG